MEYILYFPGFNVSLIVAIPLLLVFAVYFLFLNLKVIFLPLATLPLEVTSFALNVTFLTFFLDIFLAVRSGFTVILFVALYLPYCVVIVYFLAFKLIFIA